MSYDYDINADIICIGQGGSYSLPDFLSKFVQLYGTPCIYVFMFCSTITVVVIIFIWFHIYNKVRDDENIAIENYTARRRKGTGVIH